MPSRKASSEGLEKPSRKASRRNVEILSSKASQKSLERKEENKSTKRKVSQKNLEQKASQKSLKRKEENKSTKRKVSQRNLKQKASQKSLEMLSSKASQKSSEKSLRQASRKGTKKPSRKVSQKHLDIPFNKTSQKSSEKPSKKTSQNLKMLSSKVSQKSSEKSARKASQKNSKVSSRKPYQKSLESNTMSQSLKADIKAVVRSQSKTCMICKRSFTNQKMLNNHNAKHHFFRHCPNCPKTFRQTRKFIFHLRSHLNDHPYECNICLESFNQKNCLLDHAHGSSRGLKCEDCPQEFPHLAALNRHRLMHSGPPYPCEDCGAIFSNVPDSTVHIKNHVQRCVFCPKEVVAFSSNEDLAHHMLMVHRTADEQGLAKEEVVATLEACVSTGAVKLEEDSDSDSMEDILSSSDDESRADTDNNYQIEAVEPVYNLKRKDKFICFICYDLYPSPELLKSHMKAHKWYPCNSCPKFFAHAETFLKHKCDFAEVPSFLCKNCYTKIECENCKKNLNMTTVDIPEFNTNALQSSLPTYPGMPRFPIMKYYDPAERKWLDKFIQHIKSQKQPLDIKSLNHIGSHNSCLEIIIKDRRIRRLYPEAVMSDIEELYVKFQDLSQILCDRLNRSSEQ